MTENEFKAYMEKKLGILNSDERNDIIGEYIQHIENKIAEGKSEKEAVQSLGNIDDIIREILSAYNVDPDYDKIEQGENVSLLYITVSKIKSAFGKLGDFALNTKPSSIVGFLFKTILLVCILLICFVVGQGLWNLFLNIVGLANVGIVGGLLRRLYVILGVVTIIYILFRFIAECLSKNSVSTGNKSPATRLTENRGKQAIQTDAFAKFIIKIIKFAIMAIALFVLFFGAIGLLLGLVAFGALLVMSIVGYPFAGFTIACFGADIFGISVLLAIFNFVFSKNAKEV